MDPNVEARRSELEAQAMRERLAPDLSYASDEDIVREYIRRLSFGYEDVHRPGLLDTPARVARSWEGLFFGYGVGDEGQWVKDLLRLFPEEKADEMVVVKGVRVFSMCEHHLLPFYGTAAVGYVPGGGGVVGLSKLARLVHFRMARLAVQERICSQVVDDLMEHVPGIRGAGCVVTAQHLCMCARGAQESESWTVTSGLRGVLRTDAAARAEFFNLAGVK